MKKQRIHERCPNEELTFVEYNLPDHDPTCCEIKMKFKKFPLTTAQSNGDVTCILQYYVRYVRICDRFVLVIFAILTEPNISPRENLQLEVRDQYVPLVQTSYVLIK